MVLMIAPSVEAQRASLFSTEDFAHYTGVLPNGKFRFALEVLEGAPASEGFPGIPKGAFIIRVQVNFDSGIVLTEGQPEMVELLTNIGPGDFAIVDVMEASSGQVERVTVDIPLTQQQRVELKLKEAQRQKQLQAYRENVYIDGKCDRSRVVYCEWGMPSYGQLGDNAHICDGVKTTHGIFPGSNSECYGVIGWCNPMTGKPVHCP
jgi:hypothetical protein